MHRWRKITRKSKMQVKAVMIYTWYKIIIIVFWFQERRIPVRYSVYDTVRDSVSISGNKTEATQLAGRCSLISTITLFCIVSHGVSVYQEAQLSPTNGPLQLHKCCAVSLNKNVTHERNDNSTRWPFDGVISHSQAGFKLHQFVIPNCFNHPMWPPISASKGGWFYRYLNP